MIKIVNIDTEIVNIDDLGIILQPQEQTSLDYFKEINILESLDLKFVVENLKCKIYIDEENYSYNNFIKSFEKLTINKHDKLKTFVHNLNEDAIMKVTKEYNRVKFITYFTDSTLTAKTREEEIIRDNNGNVTKIINRLYDIDQNVISIEEQLLNRDTNGKVESIILNKE